MLNKTEIFQQLKKHKMTMFYDHAIQCFIESSKSHIQFQRLFREAISQHVMLSVYMLEDHWRELMNHIIYFITPMHESQNIKGGESDQEKQKK